MTKPRFIYLLLSVSFLVVNPFHLPHLSSSNESINVRCHGIKEQNRKFLFGDPSQELHQTPLCNVPLYPIPNHPIPNHFHEKIKKTLIIMIMAIYACLHSPKLALATDMSPEPSSPINFEKITSTISETKEELQIRGSEALSNIQEEAEESAKLRADKVKQYDDMFDKDAAEKAVKDGRLAMDKLKSDRANQESQILSATKLITNIASTDTKDGDILLQNLEADLQTVKQKIDNLHHEQQQHKTTSSSAGNFVIPLRRLREDQTRLEKKIQLERSLQIIKLQRAIDEEPARQRSIVNEKEKQLAMERIERLKEEQEDEYQALRSRKRDELKKLQQESNQLQFEQTIDGVDRFATRKGYFIID